MGVVAAIAIGAAITLADVATTVAIAGVALSVAGAVTKNKNLMYAGMAMGLAGGIAGIGLAATGAGAMTIEEAGTAISDFMAGGSEAAAAGATQQALGEGIVASTSPQYAENMAPAMIGNPEQEAIGQGVVAGTQGVPPTPPTALTAVPPGADQGVTATTLTQNGNIPQPGPHTAWDAAFTNEINQPTGTLNAGATPQAESSYAQQLAASNNAPATPVAQPAAGAFDIKGGLDATPGGAGGANFDPKSFLDKLPDWAKYAAITSGVQGVTGLASGYFQGLSAENKLDLDKWIAQNNQNNMNTTFARGAYAPLLRFNQPGTLNTVKT